MSPDIRIDDPLIGQLVANRFEVMRVLGRGYAGTVYYSVERPEGKPVALKVLTAACGDRTVKRFVNEIKILQRLNQANVVACYGWGRTSDGRLFIALEYVEGPTLAEYIQGRRVPLVPALRFGQQSALALAEAHHRGVLHRDLKPENILVAQADGDTAHVKVLDFGLSKLLGDTLSQLTGPRIRLGSPGYMSPEQVDGQTVDQRADLYSLGVILYQLVTGRYPFKADSKAALYAAHRYQEPTSWAELSENIPEEPALEALVRSLLAKDKEQRPRSALIVAQAIEGILARLESAPFDTRPTAVTSELPALKPSSEERDQEDPIGDSSSSRWWLLALGAVVVGAVLWLLVR